jgi:hypothetical protein
MAAAAFTGSQDDDTWRTRKKKEKEDKGKGKANDSVAGDPINAEVSLSWGATAGIFRLVGTTAVNTDSQLSQTTATPPKAVEQSRNRHSDILEPIPYASDVMALRRHNHATAASGESLWPEEASQSKWWDARKLKSKGGAGKEPKKKGGSWFKVDYIEAIPLAR